VPVPSDYITKRLSLLPMFGGYMLDVAMLKRGSKNSKYDFGCDSFNDATILGTEAALIFAICL
jgi:hypothetical protein